MSERGKDWTKIFKIHEPTIDTPIPKVGAGLMGMEDLFQEVTSRVPEFVEPAKFLGVGAVVTAGDLIGRQFFEGSAGPKTPDGFYQKELLWSVPGLLLGRIISDVVGGPAVVRALVLGTIANGVIFTAAKDFGFSTFLVREALLVPLSLLIVGRPPGQGAR